jgi:hypothetical protein
MFNTLKYAKMMEEVGFSREQAETSIGILVEIMEDKLATKQDFKSLEEAIDHKFTRVESRLTLRMGTLMAAGIAILTAILKLS